MKRRYRAAAVTAAAIPEECPENARAVKFLAKEMGAGHYDSVNLFVLATLLIFVSVSFFAVNNGKYDDSHKVPLTKENLLSGKYTQSLEESYIDQLPIPDLIKKAEERLSLIYGFGNKVTDPVEDTPIDKEEEPYNPFTPDDERSEGAVTTRPAVTDDSGKVTEDTDDETYHGGGTAAADRPIDPYMNEEDIIEDDEGESAVTTTNNAAPVVTVTTTVPAPNRPSTTTSTSTTSSSTDESSSSEPATSDPSESETLPTDTSEPVTLPPDTSETETSPTEPPVTDTEPPLTDTEPTDTEPVPTPPPDTALPPEVYEE